MGILAQDGVWHLTLWTVAMGLLTHGVLRGEVYQGFSLCQDGGWSFAIVGVLSGLHTGITYLMWTKQYIRAPSIEPRSPLPCENRR